MKILEKHSSFITYIISSLTDGKNDFDTSVYWKDLFSNLQDVPDRVPQLTVLDYSSRAANLSWVAPSDNQSPITRYTILYKPYTVDTWQDSGKETLYGSVTQAMLNGLQPNTIYTIKIRKG